MSRKEKLLKRLISKPKDFTYDELKTLLFRLGFYEDQKGKTSGSRVMFQNYETNVSIVIHKPHPNNILKPYQLSDIISELKKLGVI